MYFAFLCSCSSAIQTHCLLNKRLGNNVFSLNKLIITRTKRAALLQHCKNDFKKHYKIAVKGLVAAVANFGCFMLQGKCFDSDKQCCCSGAENSRITIYPANGCKVASKRQTMLLLLMAYCSLVQKKRNADFNNTIIMIQLLEELTRP